MQLCLKEETMIPSVAEFARSASIASKGRAGFEATQVTESDSLRIEAVIRRVGLRSIHVEYKSYQSPWTELEEVLSGQVEFIGAELCGFTLHCDGHVTWVHDASTNVAIRKLGSQLFEPIPGLATLGELSFLDTLTQDYLLRDLAEERIDDRVIRRIALKPKQPYRSQLLSAVAFPIRRATIDFDTETLFPVGISFVPSPDSAAASFVGPEATVRISYKDVRILEDAQSLNSFAPPMDARVFEESRVSIQEFADLAPFSISLSPLLDHGFEVASGSALLSIDPKSDRAYAIAQLSAADDSAGTEASSPHLTITIGNYVSRNMARRRATFSESGTPPSQEPLPLKLVDRSKLWEQRLPGIDTEHAPVEAFFEKEDVFWFLSGTGMDPASMEMLARDLLIAKDEDA
jgi:hypothetical protein